MEYCPPPVCCENLETILSRNGGTMHPLESRREVNYLLPGHISAEFGLSLEAVPAKSLPATYYASLPGGRVFGSGIVISPDGKSIARDVSPDFGKDFLDHWLLGYPKIRLPRKLLGTTAVVATNLGSGYAHWLLDELPRLITIRHLPFERLIAHGKKEYNRQAFDLAGFSGEVLEPIRLSHLNCERLLIPKQGESGYPTASLVRMINEFTKPLQGLSSFGEKIYLSREKAKRRRLVNEKALLSILLPRGFVRINVEDLSWKDQINLFRHARVIVSPHGAALANLAFCSPGTKVVELFNRSYVNGCYFRLASVQNLEYHPLAGFSDVPLSSASAHNRLDIEADIQQVLTALV